LIRLDSDKENPSLSFDRLWPDLAGFCSIWLNLA
jgi:plasmid maintenance system killer protein